MSADAYQTQDWQLPDGHAADRLADRAGDGNARRLWREAVPVDYPVAYGDAYCRFHAREDVVIIARYGFIKTVHDLAQMPDDIREHVRSQVSDA